MTRPAAAFGTGFVFQLTAMRGQADAWFSLLTAPFFALIFMSIVEFSGRGDLSSHAVIAPMLMTLWTAALSFSGEMVSQDRANGRLELLAATPVHVGLLVFGRLCACMLLALPSLLLSWLTAGLAFGYWLTVHHPVVLALAFPLTALATAATATALSAVFVLAPGARIVQNSLSFPVFLLGGVMVPVSRFPDWLEPVARAVYLSWGSDLLRAAADQDGPQHLARDLAALTGLGAAGLAIGMFVIARFLHRGRELGVLSRD